MTSLIRYRPKTTFGPAYATEPARGEIIEIDDRSFYRIRHLDQMPRFFMSLVSADDHWLFISTTGGLTAGRIDPDHALFPYETVDKIHESFTHTGPATRILDLNNPSAGVWAPFTEDIGKRFRITRHIAKSLEGDCILFEEINHDLELSFSYSWSTGAKYGFVRHSRLSNLSDDPRTLKILDGVRHIIPPGITRRLQAEYGCLADAYKTSERIENSSLAVYTLAAGITDQPIPLESLKATTVWSQGWESADLILTPDAPDKFHSPHTTQPHSSTVRGKRAAYFLAGSRSLSAQESLSWDIVADVNRTQSDVALLHDELNDAEGLAEKLRADLRHNLDDLRAKVSAADGIQTTGNREAAAHHFTNVLFNIMRGGVFADGYNVSTDDFRKYVQTANHNTALRNSSWLEKLNGSTTIKQLKHDAEQTGDADLLRLTLEYLPLTFSRRHGDPSRPWNQFAIRLRDEQGNPQLDYQGNWRDIFQNWEALALSYPDYLPHLVARFVNATSADGYNPYRLTREGIDWERPNPEEPWASIGYWGDHQIVYLLKLLEWTEAFHPALLDQFLNRPLFTFADIPYSIVSYDKLVTDPRHSIVFERDLDKKIAARCTLLGSDGKLLHDAKGRMQHAGLAEKLMIPVLAKLANFIPGGGLWMNTQRPEWNDANNALAGYGVSVVTLCYLHRHLLFLEKLFQRSAHKSFLFDKTVIDWINQTGAALSEAADAHTDPALRREIQDRLGRAASDYREKLYTGKRTGDAVVFDRNTLLQFLKLAREIIGLSLDSNRREDGLYHSYNLAHFGAGKIQLDRLQEMLEGQVAILSSGKLGAEETVKLLDSLASSPLYWKQQKTYRLYPDRALPGFLQKNCLPESSMKRSHLLVKMLKGKDFRLVNRDITGKIRFAPKLVNAAALEKTLALLKKDPRWTQLVEQESILIAQLYEEVFHHHSFTGRSGSMFGYEGLGCVYWHMVAKLLLAVQENLIRAADANASHSVLDALHTHYRAIRSGMGFQKSPEEFGAFPLDPYSHTSGDGQAQQPGMTGAVKEEILTRFGELGLRIDRGRLRFDLRWLEERELTRTRSTLHFTSLYGKETELPIDQGDVAFTLAQTPIVYCKNMPTGSIRVFDHHSNLLHLSIGNVLPVEWSQSVFSREGKIGLIEIGIGPGNTE